MASKLQLQMGLQMGLANRGTSGDRHELAAHVRMLNAAQLGNCPRTYLMELFSRRSTKQA